MEQNEKIRQRIILDSETLLHALKLMDITWFRSFIVQKRDGFFAGILSIGDIQRAIIKNMPMDQPISSVLRENPKIGTTDWSLEEIKAEMIQFRMEFLPIVDDTRKLVNVYFWDDLFLETKLPPLKEFNLPVVIMAGGIGSRMQPLTHVLPKPLSKKYLAGLPTMVATIFTYR
jgi:hypothetical protein